MAFQRVLLKLSGEALAGEKKTGFDEATCVAVGNQVKQLVDEGIEVVIVIGGGNFWRGRSSETIDRIKADYIGTLATVMNCIYVSEIFRFCGMQTEVYTPFECGSFTEMYHKDRAMKDLKEGKVVFMAGGTGQPLFSTDTITSLRAVELETDVILMARAVDGVYDSDPKINKDAKRFDRISYEEVLNRKLKILDMTATVMCMEHKVPTFLFSLNEENSIVKAAHKESIGTIIVP